MTAYGRTSLNIARSKEEKIQLKKDLKLYHENEVERLQEEHEKGVRRPGALLLDSSLISATPNKIYTHKMIQCGNYYQVYNYHHKKSKKDSELEKMKDDNIKRVDTEDLSKTNYDNKLRTIEEKNIIRTKLQFQRLIKTNEDCFKTFITLTFEENLKDVKKANKNFRIWRTKVKSKYKEFSYVCVPEFQKRGAVHYHLLTNLDIKKNSDLIVPQNDKKSQYDVKYWKYGYSSVFSVKDINVVGYMTKYMTKEIDSRLFGKRRYFYSQSLKTPCIVYLNEFDQQDNNQLSFVELFSELKYYHVYSDKLGQAIEFKEYKKRLER